MNDETLEVGDHDEVLTDVVTFLAECPAFVGVERAALGELAATARIAYLPVGQPVPEPVTSHPLVPQRGALLVRDDQERTVDLVAPCEFHAPTEDHRLEVVSAALVVVLPAAAIDLAWSAASDAVRESLHARGPLPPSDSMTAPVRSVMSRPLQTVDVRESCREVADRLRRHRIASVVVTGGDEHGIVTDRDLCNRLVAVGGSPDDPVRTIATFPVRTVDAGTPVFEALTDMLAIGCHHLPVTDGGRFVGMCSASDLLQLTHRSPVHMRKHLDAAATTDELVEAMQLVPGTVRALLAAGAGATGVGRALSAVTDRLTVRLLEFAERDLGSAPSAFAWLVFGSVARYEQSLLSDQDTGMLLPDDLDEEAHGWFAAAAEHVTAGLSRCGYPTCPGGVMASNPRWRRSRTDWARAFTAWMREPTGEAVLGATIAFDVRTAAGDLRAEPHLEPVLREARRHQLFLASLMVEALRHRPPLGFLGRVTVDRSGRHAGTFDVKAGALLPITDVARILALEHGLILPTTDERLAAANAHGTLSDDLAGTLREGHRLAMQVRLDSQLEADATNDERHGRVAPDELPPLLRSQLREVFRAVRHAQDDLERRYPLQGLR